MAAGQPLFTDLTHNPEDTRWRIAGQPDVLDASSFAVWPVPPISIAASYQDFHAHGPGLLIEKGEIEDKVLSPGGEIPASLSGKAVLNGGTFGLGTVDPENIGMCFMLANLFGKRKYTDNTTWNLRRYALNQATATVPQLCLQEDNQVTTPIRASGMKITGYNWSLSANGAFEIEFEYEADRYDLFALPTQTVGTGSTLPVVIGSFDGHFTLQATDKDIIVLLSDVTDPYVVETKISTAASHSNTQTGYVGGTWLRLQDEAGVAIGPWRDQVKLFIDTGATETILDQFEFVRRESGWSDTLATRRPITSVNAMLIVEDVEIPVNECSGSVKWESVEVDDVVSGSQGKEISRNGALVSTINLTRKIRDLLFQKAIHEETEIKFVVDAKTDATIAASGRPYRFLQVWPANRVIGPMHQTDAGGTTRKESPTLVARQPVSPGYTYDSVVYASAINVHVENGLADDTTIDA